jgi:hypothetical protein
MQLGQLIPNAQLGQRYFRIFASGDNQTRLRRQVFNQQSDGMKYRCRINFVVIFNYEDEIVPDRSDFIQ